jgi:serine/threonine protein kinase
MNEDRWQQTERIYNSALECEPDRREGYLREACGEDHSLRNEVETLLAHQAEVAGFMKAPAMEVAARVLAGDPSAGQAFTLTGRTIAHYEVLEKLGEGGMGVVYKARDTHLDRSVAIKVLPPEAVADPERKLRFVQEAKAASALNHPNIIQIHDINSDGGLDFIVMEYVVGKTLDRRIGRKGLPLGEALKYGTQIADALAAAHAEGIIHRDLKQTNIMVTDKGAVKVLDFGLAKLIRPLQSDESRSVLALKSLTDEGRIMGTIAHMSPEQAEGKKVDARSDIFSLGSMLYEMVTGQKAFQGTSKMSALSAILHKEPKPVSDITKAVPVDLEKLISRCLRKDPAKRFQHMDDVKVALEELREESASGVLEAAGVAKAKPRHRLIWAFGVAAALGMATVGG